MTTPIKNKWEIKHSLYLFVSIIVAVVLVSGLSLFTYSGKSAKAQVTSYDLNGAAWSDFIGWISFNCATDTTVPCNTVGNYKTTADSNGRLRGYAWSYNLGWVSFQDADVSGCPTSPCTPTIDLSGASNQKRVTGYGRVLSGVGRTDGFDGWIELSGVNHTSPGSGVTLYQSSGVPANSTQGVSRGAAFGSVIGWLNFDTQIGGLSCAPGTTYNFATGACENLSCGGTHPANAVLTVAAPSGGQNWSYVDTTPAGTPPTTSCKFTCPVGAPWDSATQRCVAPVNPGLCVPPPANSQECPANTGGAPIVLLEGNTVDVCDDGIASGAQKCEFYCPGNLIARSGRCLRPGDVRER